MRELKFRVWDKSSKIFRGNLYKYLINAHTGELEVWAFSDLYDEWYNTYDDKDLIVQQYTGLQDKNGKDIYEGDIVKTVNGVSALDFEFVEYTYGEIRWIRQGFEVCQKKVGATKLSVFSNCYCCPADLEIIGNIFETALNS